MSTTTNPQGPNFSMITSPQGKALIKGFEECRLEAYRNHPEEPWTIGWGNTFYEDLSPVHKGDKINQARADRLFDSILPKFERMAVKLVTRQLLQHEYDPLVSFAYNAGTGYKKNGVFIPFSIWKHVNDGWAGPALFNYWTTLAITSGGVEQRGLVRRRKSEATLYLTGHLNFFN